MGIWDGLDLNNDSNIFLQQNNSEQVISQEAFADGAAAEGADGAGGQPDTSQDDSAGDDSMGGGETTDGGDDSGDGSGDTGGDPFDTDGGSPDDGMGGDSGGGDGSSNMDSNGGDTSGASTGSPVSGNPLAEVMARKKLVEDISNLHNEIKESIDVLEKVPESSVVVKELQALIETVGLILQSATVSPPADSMVRYGLATKAYTELIRRIKRKS